MLEEPRPTDVITLLYQIALALERRFPANNTPFSYGTRLCEEMGELAEAATNWLDSQTPDTTHHLLKEIKDVLQIITGVLGYYNVLAAMPMHLESYTSNSPCKLSKDTIITITVQIGQFADAINHMERQGIKQQKRHQMPEQRLIENATAIIASATSIMQSAQLLKTFEHMVEADYQKLQTSGLIDKKKKTP